MSDNHQRYRSIRIALSQMYATEPKGMDAKSLNVLACLISGIVGSRSTNYPKIASKVPDRTKLESRVKRYSRYINEADPEQEIYLMPYAEQLLTNLSDHTLVLLMDGSDVGRNCVALMLSVQYHGRALPIGWLVISGKKGHFSQERHLQLVSEVKNVVPAGADVVFLGDGEFDGTELQQKLDDFGWKYACRTASNTILYDGAEFSFQDLLLKPGMCLEITDVSFTRQRYGPILAVAWWHKDYAEPIYLVSNFDLKEEVCYWYQKRFKIETFFSDQKSRGFHLHKSHLSDPSRLAKLMLAACLAYLWIVYIGLWSFGQELHKVVHRTDRCDLSLFQLGLRTLEHLLDFNMPIPVSFTDFSHAYPNFVR
ncbi:MAG: transposase [bacterium]|nr:transposase [bacterium]